MGCRNSLASLVLALLLPALVLLAALPAARAGRGLGTEQCPSVKDCILIATEAQVSEEAIRTGHVSTANDVTFCQETCLNARHAYYQFQPSTAQCFCFSKCSGTKRGSFTVGSVKACRKEDYSKMRQEEQQETKGAQQQQQQQQQKTGDGSHNTLSLALSLANPLFLSKKTSGSALTGHNAQPVEGLHLDPKEFARRASLENEAIQAIQTSEMGLSLLEG